MYSLCKKKCKQSSVITTGCITRLSAIIRFFVNREFQNFNLHPNISLIKCAHSIFVYLPRSRQAKFKKLIEYLKNGEPEHDIDLNISACAMEAAL